MALMPEPRRATVLNLDAALTPYLTQVHEELKKYVARRKAMRPR